MDSNRSLINAMNNVTLDDEEEGGLAIEEEALQEPYFSGFETNLCVIARFITEGNINF